MAVITLVMLAMGSSVFRPRLHRTEPSDASAMAAAWAWTPLGPEGILAAAREGWAVTARARLVRRTAPPTRRAAQTARRARATMGTPVSSSLAMPQACQLRHGGAN